MKKNHREIRRIFYEGRAQWGTVEDNLILLGGGVRVPCENALHLAPVEPTKIICVHVNYVSRKHEFRDPEPERCPSFFLKPSTALNGHQGVIYRPRGCSYLNYEGEIGVVIGKVMRGVSIEEAWDGIAGFVPANDIGCHDFRGIDRGSMLRVKGMDTFCPVGPGVVSGIDIRESILRTYINGVIMQETSASEMSFDIGYLIADLSRNMTLLPGDLILSGTPANSRPMKIGDLVEVEVTGVGRLRNTIAEAPIEAITIGFPPTVTEEVRKVSLGGDFYKTLAAPGPSRTDG